MTTQTVKRADLRRRLGYFSQADVARQVGLTIWRFRWLAALGAIPKPSATIGQGCRPYYTLQDVAAIKAFLRGTACE